MTDLLKHVRTWWRNEAVKLPKHQCDVVFLDLATEIRLLVEDIK
jgi:hypothetical protein